MQESGVQISCKKIWDNKMSRQYLQGYWLVAFEYRMLQEAHPVSLRRQASKMPKSFLICSFYFTFASKIKIVPSHQRAPRCVWLRCLLSQSISPFIERNEMTMEKPVKLYVLRSASRFSESQQLYKHDKFSTFCWIAMKLTWKHPVTVISNGILTFPKVGFA